jgi:hypothetical protein
MHPVHNRIPQEKMARNGNEIDSRCRKQANITAASISAATKSMATSTTIASVVAKIPIE